MLQNLLKSRTRVTSTVMMALLLIAVIVAANILAGASPALAGNNVRYFSFVAVTEADTNDGKVHRIGGGGSGIFDPDTGWVRGGGTFEHFDFGAPGLPKPSLGTAKWEAKRVVKFTPCTPPDTCTTPGDRTYGHITPAVVEFEVDLYFDGGRKITGATLKLICNFGPGGIINKDPVTGASLPEGYFLTYTDPDLGTLKFKPLDKIVGITHIGLIPPHELR